jgi:hypothetical protein
MRRSLSPLLLGVQGELRLVLSNCANHGDVPLQELLAGFIRGEEIVTHDIMPPQSSVTSSTIHIPWFFSGPLLVRFAV